MYSKLKSDHVRNKITRAQAIEGIQKASTWSELFSKASQALSYDRSSWGDEFEQSKEAAMIWDSAEFVVRAQSRIEARFYKNNSSTRRSVDGAELTEQSFRFAKEVACSLLSPLPLVQRRDNGQPIFRFRKYPLDVILKKIHKQLYKTAYGLHHSKDPSLESWERPYTENHAVMLLVGPHFLGIWEQGRQSEYFLNAYRSDFWSGIKNWGALSKSLNGVDIPDRMDLAQLEVRLDQAFSLSGFIWVSCGTRGPLHNQIRCTETLIQEVQNLSTTLGLKDLPVIGLGTTGISLNTSGEFGRTMGSFNSQRWAFESSFDSLQGVLAHEWTHALDYFTQNLAKKSDANLRTTDQASIALTTLKTLQDAIQNLPFCEEAWAKIDRKIDEPVVHFKQQWLRFILRKLKKKTQCNDSTTRQLRRDTFLQFHYDILECLPRGSQATGQVAHLVESLFNSQPINPQIISKTLTSFSLIYNAFILKNKLKEQNTSAYLAAAQLDDFYRNHSTSKSDQVYFSLPVELLARTGEAILGAGYYAPVRQLSTHFSDHPLPSEKELSVLRPLFLEWVHACHPLILETVGSYAKQKKMREHAKNPMQSFQHLLKQWIKKIPSIHKPFA